MEELLAGLSQFLSTPEGQKQLESVQQMLSQAEPEETPKPASSEHLPPALLGGLGKLMEGMHQEDGQYPAAPSPRLLCSAKSGRKKPNRR